MSVTEIATLLSPPLVAALAVISIVWLWRLDRIVYGMRLQLRQIIEMLESPAHRRRIHLQQGD